ncbi:MAG: tryptophan synthase subunit alpha [Candidatus Omnitrophica bacterium]|nr:tryptophan synthase subunit alpha [Candidatus Omnitrophota bacterium]
MNRIDQAFKRLKKEKKKAFIPYIAAGDPDLKTTVKLVEVLTEAGADIIELGIPFSDPLADGPTIQKAVQRSLEAGTTVKKILEFTKDIRKKVEVPLVYMTYFNIIYNYGTDQFIKDAKKCGADGLIIPDLPLEESKEVKRIADKEDFCLILLTAPTTSENRFDKIARSSRGFIYHVSLTGVTGARKTLATKLSAEVKKLKRITSKPLCVGFGVSTLKQAREVALVADGVIVGSAIIKIIENTLSDKRAMLSKVQLFTKSLARAIHDVSVVKGSK